MKQAPLDTHSFSFIFQNANTFVDEIMLGVQGIEEDGEQRMDLWSNKLMVALTYFNKSHNKLP